MLRENSQMSHFGSALTSLAAARGTPAAVLAALVVTCMATGCARQPHSQQDAHAALARPQPAYCQPQPSPDCGFENANLRTVDPVEFARLKHAYERRCVRRAEKAERERIRQLQAAGACGSRRTASLAGSR